jgi:subtilisin family serine protease
MRRQIPFGSQVLPATDIEEAAPSPPVANDLQAGPAFGGEAAYAPRRSGDWRPSVPDLGELGPLEWRPVAFDTGGEAVLTNQVLVRLAAEGLEEELVREFRLTGFRFLGKSKLALVARLDVSAGFAPEEVVAAMKRSPLVQFADPDLVAFLPPETESSHWAAKPELAPAALTQWHLGSTGVNTAGVQIEAANIKVGVIDRGFDDTDERLRIAGKHRFRFNASPWNPAISPLWTAANSYPEHGHFCAGLIGARGPGPKGTAPGAGLVLVGVDELTPAIFDAALRKCLEEEVDIICCSLRPGWVSFQGNLISPWLTLPGELEHVLRKIAEAGIPIFFAVNNLNQDLAQNPLAAHPATVPIGNHDRSGARSVCEFGERLELLAPGVEVASTQPGNRIKLASGTSYAAPCAAGVAALLMQKRKNQGQSARLADIRTAYRHGCRPQPAVDQARLDNERGWGALDAPRALALI